MLHSSFPLAIHFTRGSVYTSVPLSQLDPLSPLPCAPKSVLYVCHSIPALQIQGCSFPPLLQLQKQGDSLDLETSGRC